MLKGQRFVYKEDHHPTSANAGILNFNLLSCQLIKHKEGNSFDYFTYLTHDAASRSIILTNNLSSRAKLWRKLQSGDEGWARRLKIRMDLVKIIAIWLTTRDFGE